MIVPTYVQERIVDKEGIPSDGFNIFLRNLIQNMQLSISDEGYLIPSVTSAPNSSPPASTELGVLQASFQNNTVDPSTQTVTVGVQVGTIIFDPYEVNGATPPARNGQLKVLLADGTFHAIVNL